MYRVLAGFVAGIVLTSVVALAIFSYTQVKGQDEGSNNSSFLRQFAKVYSGAIIQPIAKAGEEIKDEDVSRYYDELVRECSLDQPLPESEDPSLTDMVPDITKINQTAITMPILKARETITDEKIREFYDRFLKSVGWEE